MQLSKISIFFYAKKIDSASSRSPRAESSMIFMQNLLHEYHRIFRLEKIWKAFQRKAYAKFLSLKTLQWWR